MPGLPHRPGRRPRPARPVRRPPGGAAAALPLDKHKHAFAAAQAAEEAAAQGKGWPYVEAVLDRVEELDRGGEAFLVDTARELGLDAEEFDTALIDGRHILIVDADQAEGKAIGVTGTPTYVIGGSAWTAARARRGCASASRRSRTGCWAGRTPEEVTSLGPSPPRAGPGTGPAGNGTSPGTGPAPVRPRCAGAVGRVTAAACTGCAAWSGSRATRRAARPRCCRRRR